MKLEVKNFGMGERPIIQAIAEVRCNGALTEPFINVGYLET